MEKSILKCSDILIWGYMWLVHSPPYSLHTLTHVLAIALGDGSKALMLVFISPSEDNVGEKICSLNFAKRTRAIESNRGLFEAIFYLSHTLYICCFYFKFSISHTSQEYVVDKSGTWFVVPKSKLCST